MLCARFLNTKRNETAVRAIIISLSLCRHLRILGTSKIRRPHAQSDRYDHNV